MRKIAFSAILLLCVSLCACGKKPVFETVDDQIVPALAEEPSYVIFVSLPQDVTEQTFFDDQNRHLCTQAEGNYEVMTEVLSDLSTEEALRSITGMDRQAITVLKAEVNGMPEYHASWTSMTDEGAYLSRMVMVSAGGNYYCMRFSAPEELGAEVQDTMEEIFASFALEPLES